MAKSKTINDDVFGQLTHVASYLWEGSIELHMLGEHRTVKLIVHISPQKGIEQDQIIAYKTFTEETKDVIAVAEQAIFNYYQSVCNELRSEYGIADPDDENVPIIKSQRELAKLLKPEGVIFPYVCPVPTFGFLYKCTWDEENGLAVKFENGKVTEVGFQDIIL